MHEPDGVHRKQRAQLLNHRWLTTEHSLVNCSSNSEQRREFGGLNVQRIRSTPIRNPLYPVEQQPSVWGSCGDVFMFPELWYSQFSSGLNATSITTVKFIFVMKKKSVLLQLSNMRVCNRQVCVCQMERV